MNAPVLNLAEVANALLWQQATSLPERFMEAYDRLLENRMRRLAEEDDGADVIDTMEVLTPEQRRRFLRSHTVAAELLKPARRGSGDMGIVAGLLIAELASLGLVSALHEDCWTPNGERCLRQSDRAAWTAGRGACVSRIVVDLQSPMDFGCESTGALAMLDPDDQSAMVDVLRTADAALGTLPDGIGGFWKACIDVVAVRRAVGATARFSSSSFAGRPRFTLLTFSSPTDFDLPLLIDALVHEAIHSLLFMYEETIGVFVREEPGTAEPRIPSPWTGASLRLASYVHACVVWYGLYWLWTRLPAQAAIGEAPREVLRQRARRGFDARPVSVGLKPYIGRLSPEIIALLNHAEARIWES